MPLVSPIPSVTNIAIGGTVGYQIKKDIIKKKPSISTVIVCGAGIINVLANPQATPWNTMQVALVLLLVNVVTLLLKRW